MDKVHKLVFDALPISTSNKMRHDQRVKYFPISQAVSHIIHISSSSLSFPNASLQWAVLVFGKRNLVRVGTTLFPIVTPEGNCQDVDHDDNNHNQTNGSGVPVSEIYEMSAFRLD